MVFKRLLSLDTHSRIELIEDAVRAVALVLPGNIIYPANYLC